MDRAILLAVAASFCTATSSVCQRFGARQVTNRGAAGAGVWLIFRLARRPIWLAGLVSMILGFAFQLAALHFGALALVQPAGLGLLLLAASPSGGRLHAPGSLWWLAGLATLAVVLAGLALAAGLDHRSPASGPHRAAVLGPSPGSPGALSQR